MRQGIKNNRARLDWLQQSQAYKCRHVDFFRTLIGLDGCTHTGKLFLLRVPGFPPRQDAEGRARRKLADCDVTVSRLACPEITSIQGVLVVPACKVLLIGACRAPLLAPKLLLAGRTNEGR